MLDGLREVAVKVPSASGKQNSFKSAQLQLSKTDAACLFVERRCGVCATDVEFSRIETAKTSDLSFQRNQ